MIVSNISEVPYKLEYKATPYFSNEKMGGEEGFLLQNLICRLHLRVVSKTKQKLYYEKVKLSLCLIN
jgi:hypothetical protein